MELQTVSEVPRPPARSTHAHKGNCGRALVIAGSAGMSGAACLAGMAALRSGAGLVTVACPWSIQPLVAMTEPSYLTMGLKVDIQGKLGREAFEALTARLAQQDAIAIGPGCGVSEEFIDVVASLYAQSPQPLVIDADAINALARREQWPVPAESAGPRLLTPHAAEFGRLLSRTPEEVNSRREGLAVEFAQRSGCIVVLKGPNTVVTDGSRLYVNQTGNAGLATGGTGDVLTGLLVGLLAQQSLPAFETACFAVHLHGLAGDLAAEDLSQPGLIASDLPMSVARAWKQLGY